MTSSRPRRPTSLSLENICCPDFGPGSAPATLLRRTKSFSTDVRYHQEHPVHGIPFGSNYEFQSFATASTPKSSAKEPEDETPSPGQEDEERRSSGDDSQTFVDVERPDMVSVSVATANGKIGPDIVPRPKVYPKLKVRTPTTIDHSFSKGGKKEVTAVDHSLSRSCEPKPKVPTVQDFSLNKSSGSSSRPTANDFTYGDHSVKRPTCRDYSVCVSTDPKPPTKYNYAYARGRPKPNTKYDYRYNWQLPRPATRYNYTFYRGYKLVTTQRDYSCNKKKSEPVSNICFCFKTDYARVKASPTSQDHSFDKSTEKKQPTTASSSYAPLDQEPKQVTDIDFALAPKAPKKSPTFEDTSGGSNKQPTHIDTRSNIMIDEAQVVSLNDDIQDNVSMMKGYIENVERKALEKEKLERERRKELRLEREKQIGELMQMYGKKGKESRTEPERKDDVIKELIKRYGQKDSENHLKPTQFPTELGPMKNIPRKVSVSPRPQPPPCTESSDIANELETKDDMPEQFFLKKSTRPRPTFLNLNLSYETDDHFITL